MKGDDMRREMLHRIREQIAAVSVAAGCGLGISAAALAAIPAPVIVDLLDEMETTECQTEESEGFLSLFLLDPRPTVRSRAIEVVAVGGLLGAAERESLLKRHARDPSRQVRGGVARALFRLLDELPVLDRTATVASWAASEAVEERLAVAQALSWPVTVLGGDLACDLLCRDPHPSVRRAAAIALAERATAGDRLYWEVARGLLSVPDRTVRRMARKVFRGRDAKTA